MAIERSPPSVALVLKELNSILNDGYELTVKKENIKQLLSFLERIKQLLGHLGNDSFEGSSEGARAVIALSDSLKQAQEMLNKHKSKRRLFWLIYSRILNQDVEEVVHSIGKSLSLVQLAKLPSSEDLSAELDDLIHQMEETHYEVTDTERRVNIILESSALDSESLSSLAMIFSTYLGINFERDKELLYREVRVLKDDLNTGNLGEQQARLMNKVDEVLDYLSSEKDDMSMVGPDENEVIPSFDAFECPLTKQIMEDPVVLQSEQTYERRAIEQWFKACREQNREPTCPISGKVLTSTELLPNLVLRQTIEEWYQRNVTVRINIVGQKLKSLEPIEEVDMALDEIYRLANEKALNKFKLKEANLIPDIGKIWNLKGAAYLRAKALIVLHKMAIDDLDNQHVMVKEGLLRLAVRSLGSREDEEKGNAAKLLYHLSEQLDICAKLGTEKGAIIHLVGLTASKDEALSAAAESTLKNLEQVDSNVLEMAEAGRFQPLLTRLCNGSEDNQIEMAGLLAKRHLVNSQKERIAKSAVHNLVNMLSRDVKAKEASLGALLNLSSLEGNVPILIKAGILPPLLDIMFNIRSSLNPLSLRLKEEAAAILATLVSTPGNWEGAAIDAEGNSLESEYVIHNLLGLLAHVKPNWKDKLLQILLGLASSPDVAGAVCMHISSGNGIKVLVGFLSRVSEASHRLNALKLLAVLSARIEIDVFRELDKAEPGRLKDVLKSNDTEERVAAASILSNTSMTEQEVARFLGPDLIGWIVNALSDARESKHGKSFTRLMTALVEGLLGVLLHLVRCSDPRILSTLKEHEVMTVLVNQLQRQGYQPLVKQRVALGLRYLSEKAPNSTRQPEPSPTGLLACFQMFNSRSPKLCPVHSGICEPSRTFCLVESKGIVPLLELLEEDEDSVRVAAIEALSTLLADSVNLRGTVEELLKVEGVQKIFDLFFAQSPGEVQERTVWMIERILRVEDYAKEYSVDPSLFRALVEAFKHGTPATKGLAQDALTHLKQLSGISAGNRRKKPR